MEQIGFSITTLLLPLVSLAIAYLFGAIPFGLLIGKARGIDVRTVGSQNIGATNVFRCVGAKEISNGQGDQGQE